MNREPGMLRKRLVVMAAVAASLGIAAPAPAQELLWSQFRTTFGDWYGSGVEIARDSDGDGLDDVLVGGSNVDCTGVDDGFVELRGGIAGVKRVDWCGDEEVAGAKVVSVRDVDGDGVPEIVTAGPFRDDVIGGFDCGRVVLVSGASGQPIWELVGEQPDDRFGVACRLGDVDGDGFDELLAGSVFQGTLNRGRVYVISSFDGHVIRTHDGTLDNEWLGSSLTRCDDVDGDGVVDYAVSTLLQVDFDRGRVDLYSGASGALLWSKTGEKFEGLGSPTRAIGDWDGDGRGDLVCYIGSLGDGALRIYSPWKDEVLAEFIYYHPNGGQDSWGQRLCRIGDLDADGVEEIAVAAITDGHDGSNAGRVDLYSGRTLRPLYHLYPFGVSKGWFGWSMASEGDLNGDAIPDLVVGAPFERFSQPKGGSVYAFALNDLYLQAEPLDPLPGDSVVVDLRGGPPGLLGMVVLTDISGTPVFEPLLLAPFDSNGELQLSADIDASVSGLDFTIVAFSQNRKGRGPLMDSLAVTVSVQ